MFFFDFLKPNKKNTITVPQYTSGHGTWACVIIKKIQSVNTNDKLSGIFKKLNILKIKINLIENINEVRSPKLKS